MTAPAPAATEPYRPIRGLATALPWLFLALVIADVGAVVFDVLEYRLYSRFEAVGGVPADEGLLEAIGSGIVAFVQFGLFVATAVVFIIWTHRAYRNLRPLGAAQLRFQPGWAIGGWFVPIMNLWRPKQIANDVWRGSDATRPPSRRGRGANATFRRCTRSGGARGSSTRPSATARSARCSERRRSAS